MNLNSISLPEIVGKGYGDFWRCKKRYRVVKGSRASKKSKTTALWFIVNLMQYPQSNALVIRKTFRTLKDSCFTELKWAINRLGVNAWWDCKESPLEMTYKPTGQKIYFRGLDDPLKITSITVNVGVLCWAWLEEAYEVMSESDFDTLDESIRGSVPDGIFKQWTITFNPWNEKHWLKKRFFDRHDDDTFAITTNYLCNEWLDDSDLELFNAMAEHNPRRYQVAGLGNWGISEGLVYERWRESDFVLCNRSDSTPCNSETVILEECKSAFGLDFGYTNDPTALFCGMIDEKRKKIYVFDELYQKGLSNQRIKETICAMGYGKERITADSAEPKSIDELKSMGLKVTGAKKGRDSINNGIQFIQDFEIVVHPRCVNFITEISNYTWGKDKFGASMNRPIDDYNHLMDSMRYALEKYIKQNNWLI